MKALSIRQPWAWLIIYAGKDIENRVWRSYYRGPILVHASSGMTPAEYEDAEDFAHSIGVELPAFEQLPRGGIVGSVDVIDCVSQSQSRWFNGPFGFVLSNPKALEFRPLPGKLGFFDVPDSQVFA